MENSGFGRSKEDLSARQIDCTTIDDFFFKSADSRDDVDSRIFKTSHLNPRSHAHGLQGNNHSFGAGHSRNLRDNVSKKQKEIQRESHITATENPSTSAFSKTPFSNVVKVAETKVRQVKRQYNLGDRELRSPISFANNDYLANGSDVAYRSGRQSVPIYNHKSYLLPESNSSKQASTWQTHTGTEKFKSTKQSNHVLKRIVGREAIDQFFQRRSERPHSVTQPLLGSPKTYGAGQIVDKSLDRSYSENSLQPYQNTSNINESMRKSRDNMSRVVSSSDFQGSKASINHVETPSNSTDSTLSDGKNPEDSLIEVSSQEISEKKPLMERAKSDSRTFVYKRRWYLLFLFSLTSMLWSAVWSTWGPIAQSAKSVYGWDDAVIAMFTWLGNIPFLVTMFPIAYLMDVKGMRTSMILCCGLIFLGTGLRCIPADDLTTKWLIYGGQLLNGVAGTVPMSGSALLSGLWFPSNQRATATAISTIAGYLGASISFVFGPLFVPEDDDPTGNDTVQFLSSNGSDPGLAEQKSHIMYILYSECGAAGLLLVLVLIYFPSKPVLPPSISASIPREKYLDGLKMLVRNKQFWITAIAFSFPAGVYEAWQVVLDVNLDPKVSQTTAGWMDFYATVGGCISGMMVSRFADYFTRQMKLFLLIFYFLAAIAFLWCTFIVTDILPFDTVSLYAAIILGGVFLDGGAPLFFELVIEVSYPVGEGVTSGCVQMICSLAGIVFLSLVQADSTDKQWMNWCFFSTITMAIPLLFFVKANYGRADIDDLEVSVEEDAQSVNQ